MWDVTVVEGLPYWLHPEEITPSDGTRARTLVRLCADCASSLAEDHARAPPRSVASGRHFGTPALLLL